MPAYISAFERLSKLPEVFSINTLVRYTGLSRAAAKVTLNRWSAHKLVQSAGPKTGIYFNRVLDPKGQRASAVKGLQMKYPSATLCGASVLHAAGWTTQIPTTLHAAIEARASYVSFEGVTLHPKPLAWFVFMHKHSAWVNAGDTSGTGTANTGKSTSEYAPEFPTFGLCSLRPAWALADLYADTSTRAWKPDEDDLDIEPHDLAAVRIACEAMGVANPAYGLSIGD